MPSFINNTNLPRLAAQKNQVQQSAAAKKFKVLYTADEVRKMPPSSPVRAAYQVGGDLAVRAYLAAQ